jgi:two-component system, NtrC family, sensor kinase
MSLTPRSFISLRTRFMALAVLLTLLFSAIWGIWIWNREKNLMYDRLSQKGEIMASTMAIPIITALLYEDLGIISEGGLLDNFVADIMANDHLHPLYAVVLDQEGRVLAHNRYSEYGKIYEDRISRGDLNITGFTQRAIFYEGQAALDMAIPLAIAGKRWGCLCIGVPLAPLQQELRSLGGQVILFSGAFSVVALALFYLVGGGLARPLVDLAGHMEQVNQGALSYLPGTERKDEIGLLQNNFQRMLERLHRSEVEREASIHRMLENERLATVGKIVSGVAHEVNNPLAGIQGALYHIEQKGGPGVRRYTSLVETGVERIGRIVNQLLDLSRAAAIEMEEVDSRAFFEEIVLFARMALKSKPVQLLTKDLCPPSSLYLDRDKVHQVVLNLVLNAADAAGEGGTVELESSLTIGWYALTIVDNGPGVPAAIRDRIFDPFFTTKEPGKGSGMGLTISRSIAESHGGILEYRGEGEGTSFTLQIPLHPSSRKA